MKTLVVLALAIIGFVNSEAKANTFGNYIVSRCVVVDGLAGSGRSVEIGVSSGIWFYKYANFYTQVVVPGAQKQLVDRVSILKTEKRTKALEVLSGTSEGGKNVEITIELNKTDKYGATPGILVIGSDKLSLSCQSLNIPM